MGTRQHRCPFYLLKIDKNEYESFKTQRQNYDNIINNYQNKLNIYSHKLTKYESIIQQISNSFNALILVKKYIKFCNDKIHDKMVSSDKSNSFNEIPSIYNPENANEFITTRKPPYHRTTVKKHLNTLLRLLKISTNNPFLSYSLPLGHGESTKLKHLLTNAEINSFISYLNTKHYIPILITMFLYKFGMRISSVAKLKCSDLGQDN